MKRTLVLLLAAGVCGCSAGLVGTESVWTGTRIPAGAEEAGGGFPGQIMARLGASFYTTTAQNSLDPRFTMGFGYTMTFDWGDIEVGFDAVPDTTYWLDNVYYNVRGDYVYWFGQTHFAVTAGLGWFVEDNTVWDGKLYGSSFLHLDLGAIYLIEDWNLDVRLALQIPVGGDLNVTSILLLSLNYAFF